MKTRHLGVGVSRLVTLSSSPEEGGVILGSPTLIVHAHCLSTLTLERRGLAPTMVPLRP